MPSRINSYLIPFFLSIFRNVGFFPNWKLNPSWRNKFLASNKSAANILSKIKCIWSAPGDQTKPVPKLLKPLKFWYDARSCRDSATWYW